MAQHGFGERLKSRLKAVGYWKHDRPDVARFALERGYRPQYVYAWLRDRIPDYENRVRLARDLQVAPNWLRFGDGAAEDQAVSAVSGRVLEHRRGPAPAPPGSTSARPKREPDTAARTARVIEHPLLRLTELSEKLSTAESQLRDAIRALTESEERFRRVFDEGPLGMGIADPEGRLVKVNRRQCEMLGYREEELIGRPFLDQHQHIKLGDPFQSGVVVSDEPGGFGIQRGRDQD
jgi:PAS domain-containing protein